MQSIPRTLARCTPVAALALAGLLTASSARAVILDGMNECTVKLGDGTDVVLIGEYQSIIGQRGVDQVGDGAVPSLERFRHLTPPPPAVTTRTADAEEPSARQQGLDRINALRAQYSAPTFSEHVKTNRFYYLPPGNSLHLSKRPDGVPEFLFVKYTSDEKGGAQGGLMHFLMEWSLTPGQEDELRTKVASTCRVNNQPGELVGHVPLDEAAPQGSFRIISATLTDNSMTRSLVQSGHAPTLPGGKIAAAANLSKDGAQLFLATVEKSKSIADLSVELDYNYTIQLPAAKGEIIFHWDKFQEKSESFEASTTREDDTHGWWIFRSGKDTTYSQEQVESAFNSMVENGFVEMKFEGYSPDSEYTSKVMEAMLQFFTNSLMQPADPMFAAPQEDDGGEEYTAPELEERGGDSTQTYTFKQDKLEQAFAAKQQVVRMNMGLAVRRPIQVVGNMASWYRSVKDNRNCVQEVNLNDPFFQHRDIRFILDLGAKEIFDDIVNYVTVNVKKQRASGPEFNQSLTIDAEYLKKNGIAASMSYARGNERGTEAYMYQTQWSLKGGNLFPATPRWQQGTWEGVTLAPPVERWFVEVEGDLDQFNASDIARVTVELHYPLFGEEKFKVIALSPAKGEALVGDHIYVDRGTRGFAYRLIVHHKKDGRMALPWQTRIGDRYVYATLPSEILVDGNPRSMVIEAGRKLGQMGAEKVLDKFQELFSQGH